MRMGLFKASSGDKADQGNQGGGEAAKVDLQGKHKPWKPITNTGKEVVGGDRSGKNGTLFAGGTVFNEKTSPEKEDAGKKNTKKP